MDRRREQERVDLAAFAAELLDPLSVHARTHARFYASEGVGGALLEDSILGQAMFLGQG